MAQVSGAHRGAPSSARLRWAVLLSIGPMMLPLARCSSSRPGAFGGCSLEPGSRSAQRDLLAAIWVSLARGAHRRRHARPAADHGLGARAPAGAAARLVEFVCPCRRRSGIVLVVGPRPVYRWVTYLLRGFPNTLTFVYVVLVLPLLTARSRPGSPRSTS